jgi:predicted small lipoprotein YifL
METKFKEKGNYTLSAVISITAGITFLFGVVNLTRYAHAVNVVEQASRSVARCLTPTDSECFSLDFVSIQNTDVTSGIIQEWFGIRNSQIVIPAETSCSSSGDNQQTTPQIYFELDNGEIITKPEDCKVDLICKCSCSCLIQYEYLLYPASSPSESELFSADLPIDNREDAKWSTNCPIELGNIVAMSTGCSFRYANSSIVFTPLNYLGEIASLSSCQISFPLYLPPDPVNETTTETSAADDDTEVGGDTEVCEEKPAVVTSVVERISLGKSGGRPQACDDFDDCQSEYETLQYLSVKDLPSDEQSTQLAKQKGYAEIARTFADYQPNCDDHVNCSQISITQSGANVLIDVSYNLQLTFPFDLLVGDFFQVRTKKEEAMELFVEPEW